MQTGGALAAAIEALLPSMCPHCDHPLEGGDRGLCGACWALTVPRSGLACPRCGVPANDGEDHCFACDVSPPPHRAAVVWGEYDGVLRTAILALKHGGRDDLAGPLGDRLAALISLEPWASGIDVVVPVPSHPWRRLKKPWTASELLAQRIARRIEKPVIPLLRRHGFGRQARRTRARRLGLTRGSFSARSRLQGHAVLLIDDVTTTGTTLRRASEVLLGTGAGEVFCAVCAQAPDSRRLS